MPPVNETLDSLRDAARRVLRELGPGHSEAAYHAALLCDLVAHGVPCRSEVCCPFMYGTQCIGHGRADVVVANVAVELKLGDTPSATNRAQLLRYVQSLGRTEGREFVGVLLCVSRATAALRMQALDADGDVIYTYPPAAPPAKRPADEDAVVMHAFQRRYKFSRAATPGIPLARLRAHLRRSVSPSAAERFIRRHFASHTELRAACARTVVVCRPRAARGVVLV
jgi:GxxExxY protein